MKIERGSEAVLEGWVRLRLALWSEPSEQSHRDDIRDMLGRPGNAAFIARSDDGTAIGLAEAALRHDYVNGCETSPVGFLEGIYVAPEQRRHGVARALCHAVENWAAGHGCAEFASDADLAQHRLAADARGARLRGNRAGGLLPQAAAAGLTSRPSLNIG